MKYGYEWGDEIAIGLFWKRDDLPALDQLEPVLDGRRPAGAPPAGRLIGDRETVGPRADVKTLRSKLGLQFLLVF